MYRLQSLLLLTAHDDGGENGPPAGHCHDLFYVTCLRPTCTFVSKASDIINQPIKTLASTLYGAVSCRGAVPLL